jgi:steroid delta-isomerase-like uncharacterized protein
MTVEENKALVRRFVEALWNAGDLTVVDDLVAPDFVNHSAAPGTRADREGFRQAAARTRALFPDFHVTVEELIAEGEAVVVRFTARGTLQLAWEHPIIGPIGATGRQATWTGMRLFHLAGGRITETWVNADTLAMMQQLGALPRPGETTG